VTMAMADLTLETVGEIVVARLDGEIDISNAAEIGEALSRAVFNEALGLLIDLSEVDYLDSAAIQVIFELRERLEMRRQRIRLVIAPDSPIAETLRVSDVPAAVGADETPEAALRSMAG
jgi:anti-sigma B factor antagonist